MSIGQWITIAAAVVGVAMLLGDAYRRGFRAGEAAAWDETARIVSEIAGQDLDGSGEAGRVVADRPVTATDAGVGDPTCRQCDGSFL